MALLGDPVSLILVMDGEPEPLAGKALVKRAYPRVHRLCRIGLAIDGPPEELLGLQRHQSGGLGRLLDRFPVMLSSAELAEHFARRSQAAEDSRIDLDAGRYHPVGLRTSEYQMRQ